MTNFILKTTLLFLFSALTLGLSAQTVQRTTFAVFSSITPNDTLLVAGGQIMTGKSDSPLLEHGYYPLNNTLLSVEKSTITTAYSIYPNPFSSSLQINWTNSEATVISIEIYSINGALIQRIETSDSQIEILSETWERGMYFVRGVTEQGTLFNEKVVKS
tara:strand:+ start:107 stop:586 length:480 start_codon:yes stop_codon:yes gene_type:complete